tara:strand:+ start:1443 stop:2066 length:624 start_codon:yes stop_codon:yes gene_type:complete
MTTHPDSAKVYMLTSKLTNQCYIGSTTYKYLSQRLNVHRQAHRERTINYGDLFGQDENDNLITPDITLLELVENGSREDLFKCEQKWIDTYDDLCVNKKRAWVSPETLRKEGQDAVSKYQSSPAGKLSIKKAAERAQIKTIQNRMEQNINVVTKIVEGTTPKSQKNLLMINKLLLKISKQRLTRNRHLDILKELCPDDPLLLSLGHY